MKKYIFLFFSLLVLTSCTSHTTQELTIQTSKENIIISIELADSEQEREKGLMFRKSLEEKSGMLFVFDQEQVASFWMKNTLIPLDILFINNQKKIVAIERNVPPCQKDSCPLYSASEKVKYLLELNSGFADMYNVQVGDSIYY